MGQEKRATNRCADLEDGERLRFFFAILLSFVVIWHAAKWRGFNFIPVNYIVL